MGEGKPWYTNTYFLVIVPITVFAFATAALVLLVLPRSAESIKIMQGRMTDAKSLYVESEFSYEGTVTPRSGAAVTPETRERVVIVNKGWLDRYGGDPGILDQTFTARMGYAEVPDVLAGQFVQNGPQMYANLSVKPESIGELPMASLPTGTWLRFTPNTLAKHLHLPELGGEGKDLTAEDRTYLKQQFRATPFLRLVQKLSDETIRGVATHHYQVMPEKLFIKDFVFIEEITRHKGVMPPGQENALNRLFDNLSATDDGEIWIGKQDFYLHRARFKFRYQSPLRTGVLTLTINFSRFNEHIGLATPRGTYHDLDGYLAQIEPQGQGGIGIFGAPSSGVVGYVPPGGAPPSGGGVGGSGVNVNTSGGGTGEPGGAPSSGGFGTSGGGSGTGEGGTGSGATSPTAPVGGGGAGTGMPPAEDGAPRTPPTLTQIFAALIKEILKWLGVVMVLMFMYGGTVAMLSKGDPVKMRHAKKIIVSAIIGTLIILGSHSFVSYLLKTVWAS